MDYVQLVFDRPFQTETGVSSTLTFYDSVDSFTYPIIFGQPNNQSSLTQFIGAATAPGAYNVATATVVDKAGNSRVYSNTELVDLGISSFFQVVNSNAAVTAAVPQGPIIVREDDGGISLGLTLKNVGSAAGSVYLSLDPNSSSTADEGVDMIIPTEQTQYSISQSPSGDYTLMLPKISIIDDIEKEGQEFFRVRVYAPGLIFANGTDSAVVTIQIKSNDIYGNEGANTITGTELADYINGGQGVDVLYGLAGDDILDGGLGDDRLAGGLGADRLTGGDQVDLFVGTRAELAGDTITDLEVGERILISDANPSQFTLTRSGDVVTFGPGQSLTLEGFSGRLVAVAAPEGGVALVSVTPTLGDVNGDGRADVLWRSGDGHLTNWLTRADGSFYQNPAIGNLSAPTAWSVVATADVNGDGRTDILWRHTDGSLIDWLGRTDGTYNANDSSYVAKIPTAWKIAGVANIDGHYGSDILWRHDSGALTVWLADDSGRFFANDGLAYNSGVSDSWHVEGLADFSGDGRADILWRHNDGSLTTWLGNQNGSLVQSSFMLAQGVSSNWQVAGVGDINGDGHADILWQNAGGSITDWLGRSDGGFTANDAVAFTGAVPAQSSIAELADFNGDGNADILWRNSEGIVTAWSGQDDGSFVAAAAAVYAPPSWQIQFENFGYI